MNPILHEIDRAGNDLFRAYAFNENKRQNDLANRLAEAANKRYDEQHEQQMQTQNAERMLRIFEAGSPEVAYKLSEIYGMPVEGWEGPQMQITGPRGNTWVGSRKILADATKMGLSGQQEQALQYLQENGGMVIPKQQPNSLEGMYTQAIQSGDPRQVQAVMALTEGWKGLGQQEDPYSGLTGDAKNLAIMGGKVPSLDDYSKFKEQTRPQTNINMGDKTNKLAETVLDKLPEKAEAAENAVGSIERIDTILDIVDRRGDSVLGLMGDVKRILAPYASAAGVNIEGMDDAQLLESLVKQGAGGLRMEVIGPGPVSEYEQKVLQAVSGGKMSTAEGIKSLLTYNRKSAKRTIERYNKAVKTLSSTEGYEKAQEYYAPLNVGERKAAEPAETPPMQGAKKAKDGNWYVEKNGKFFKVVE